jgi:hypothetical protein
MASENQKWVVVSGLYEIPGVYARDLVASTTPLTQLRQSTTISPFQRISAPIPDAIFRFKDVEYGVEMTDAGGSRMRLLFGKAAPSWIRFESATGRAFVTDTDTWIGGSEITERIINGPGPGVFLITPQWVDPMTVSTRIDINASAQVGAQPMVQVRGKGAYLV